LISVISLLAIFQSFFILFAGIIYGFEIINQFSTNYAFAQQGKIRCTSGNLVSSPGQCPSSDICPSVPSGSEIAQCTSRESKPNEGQQSSTNSPPSMSVKTDKQSYDKGETVKVVIQNTGDQPFRVSDLNFNLTIINLATNQSYPLIHRPASILAVDAGTSRTYPWSQLDSQGKQARDGNYMAFVEIGPFHGNATFSLGKK
jgi:hypothetical protein